MFEETYSVARTIFYWDGHVESKFYKRGKRNTFTTNVKNASKFSKEEAEKIMIEFNINIFERGKILFKENGKKIIYTIV